ncbi:hypothetical protein DSUL_50246 [Desulfovibrionales bacterium]
MQGNHSIDQLCSLYQSPPNTRNATYSSDSAIQKAKINEAIMAIHYTH